MDKYYYDTSVFGYFVFENNWEHEYSPQKIKAYISIFCEEELVNVVIKNGKFNEFEKVPFHDLLEKIFNMKAYFQASDEDIKVDVIREKFLNFMGSISQNDIDLHADFEKNQKNKKELKTLDGMDWLHLAFAEVLGCNILLTSDRGFEYLSKIGKLLKFNNIKKIIIFKSNEKLEKIKEFTV